MATLAKVNSQLWTRFDSHVLLLPLVNNSFSPPPLGRAAPGTESGWREQNTHLVHVPRSQAVWEKKNVQVATENGSYAQAVGTRPFSPSHTWVPGYFPLPTHGPGSRQKGDITEPRMSYHGDLTYLHVQPCSYFTLVHNVTQKTKHFLSGLCSIVISSCNITHSLIIGVSDHFKIP